MTDLVERLQSGDATWDNYHTFSDNSGNDTMLRKIKIFDLYADGGSARRHLLFHQKIFTSPQF